MIKSIWHKLPSQPEEDRLIVVKSKRTGEYLVGNEFEFILDNFTKWAYFDDLLALETELDRTRKALDVAKDKLDTVRQYHRGTAVVRPDDITAYCDRAIEQITALEQKD